MKEYLAERAFTAVYSVKGRNVGAFLSRISRRGVKILRAKPSDSGIILTIPSSDCAKLFAICKEMCYTITGNGKNESQGPRNSAVSLKFLRKGGFLRFIGSLLSRPGFAVGAALFVLAAFWADGTVLNYSLEGVDANDVGGVMRTVGECGAVRFARFSSLDLDAIARAIVQNNDGIAFATVGKRGSCLTVQTLPRPAATPERKAEDYLSPEDGVVEHLAVFRGTPLVEAGAAVKKGTPLVGAYFTAGESTVRTCPVFELRLRSVFVLRLKIPSGSAAEQLAAIAVAKEKCPESHIIDQKVTVDKDGEAYLATVEITYIKTYGG